MRTGIIVAYSIKTHSGYIRDVNDQKIKFRSSIPFQISEKVCFEIMFIDNRLMATDITPLSESVDCREAFKLHYQISDL